MTQSKLYLLMWCMMATILVNAGNSKSASDDKDFKTTPARSDFDSYPVGDGGSVEVMSAFLQKQCSNLQAKSAGLQLTHSSTSLAAYHYTFLQTYSGIPVYSSGITVNVSKKNVVFAIFDDSYDMSDWNVNTTAFDYHSVKAYQEYVPQYFPLPVSEEAKQMIAFDEKTNAPVFCYAVTISDQARHQREVLVGRDGIIYERDRNMYYAAPDSTVTGMVFNPDPITTAHVAYGGAYTNQGDSDVAVLNAQRQLVHFKADFDPNSGIFSLNNQYVQLQSSTVTPVTSNIPDFSYTRAHSGFEDVMVFYHLNKMRTYLHDLGFHCGDTLVIVDPHGTTQDNSWFSQSHYLTFGTGGIPDAQDADVIIHEYTHFLSYWANGSNSSGQRASLDEGICDYNAASYSRAIDPFDWQKVYNFDGNNAAEGWYGRIVNDFTIYPAQPQTNVSNIYRYCETWASALMSIWSDLGRNVTDSLAFESLYSYGGSTTLPQAAQLVINADCMLFNGIHIDVLAHDFALHGLGTNLRNCMGFKVGIEEEKPIMEAIHFAANEEKFRVIVPQNDISFNIDLYDMTGKKLASYQNNTSDIKPELPNGIYIVDVTAQGAHKSFKWVLVR